MEPLGKLPTALISVFAVLLAVILADVVYFLWRRRSFHRRSLGDGAEDQAFPTDLFYAPSKELLYFFCWKNQSRVKPDSALPRVGSSPDRQAEAVDELDKWQRLYGPSRMLFTIKEEDREGSDHSDYSEKGRRTRPVSTDEGFGFVLGTLPEVSVVVDDVDEVTPFSTPCASPPYYTPSPSPPRDVTHEGGDVAEV